MKTMIYCEPTQQGVHSFYLVPGGEEYFLFSQKYRKGVQKYFSRGVSLDDSMKFAKAKNDSAFIRTMTKLPMYILCFAFGPDHKLLIHILFQWNLIQSKFYHKKNKTKEI